MFQIVVRLLYWVGLRRDETTEIEELKWEVDETRVAYEEARDFYIEARDAKDDAYLVYVLAKGRLDKYQEQQQQQQQQENI